MEPGLARRRLGGSLALPIFSRLPSGEGGPPDGGPGEGSVADETVVLDGLRLLATHSTPAYFRKIVKPAGVPSVKAAWGGP